MQAETALGRVGLWFLVMLVAMAAALGAADSGFAAHAWVIAALGFVMLGQLLLLVHGWVGLLYCKRPF